ncbi:zinc ribbon domain-containing protein [Massilia endophytica]|uniref:zinc ribbon domain-containing protein n=1 Tax=Massilia endophytica TaxID=2899220 RepID=UPI001E28CCB3|nr:zinc ribbon domain-containing protein [Massilia endophytica]UGQ44776.1 zinc ribbon domain-containing protein [Massilia endophytica]
MSKALRLSEKWFQRGLWLVALVFAGFLIGLGGKVVENMNLVEEPLVLQQFVDEAAYRKAEMELQLAEAGVVEAQAALEQARQKHKVAASNSQTASETFDNWLSTRRVTARPEQDPELIARTRELDGLKAAERTALGAVQAQEQKHLHASQARDRAATRINQLEASAQPLLDRARQMRELRVFGYRLALTLPLLAAAGWLWMKQRKSTYWPFVWGFIFFALFAFFVELVPYLPSYGGYVRYVVGILLTVVVGRQAIVSLQRYLERQRAAEALPDNQRRQDLSYEVAQARLAKGVCPGCERPADLKDPKMDFCPHCGIGLFNRCTACDTRKNAFTRFCFSCGTPAATAPVE